MGGYGPAIANNMIQTGQEDLARNRMLEDEQRRTKLGILTTAYGQTTDPSQREQIQGAITSLYPTPAHAPQFFSDILHLKGRQQAQQSTPTAAPTAASTSTPSSGATDMLGVPFSGTGSTSPTPAAASTPASAPTPSTPTPSTPSTPSVSQVAQAPTAADAWKQIAQIPSPTETNINTQKRAAENAQALAKLNNEARERDTIIRTQGNAAMQKLDAAAQTLGAESFATADPDTKMAAMKAIHTANVTSSWKSVTDGNDVYAVDAHDPSKRQLIGHKDDLTQHLEYKTLTNADGSQYEVPFVTWTKKGSTQPLIQTQGDVGSAPTSSKTPAGPTGASTPTQSVAAANPGARPPGTKPTGGAVKGASAAPTAPTSTGLPKGAIPFGSKGSPLLKSDQQQYTKLAEDSNAKQEALTTAKAAAASPSPSSDQELIYSWVRSNVQGAGRMTQAEFSQAARLGSLPQKAQNWYSMASTGKLTPEIRNMMLTDITRSAQTSKQAATDLRTQIDQEMHNPNAPVSASTPSGPGAWKPPADAPAAPKIDGKLLKANGQTIAVSQGGQWVQP